MAQNFIYIRNRNIAGDRNLPNPKQSSKQALLGQFTRAQLRRMVGATERQLGIWERKGWIQPLAGPTSPLRPRPEGKQEASRATEPHQPRYTFADVAALRTILRLRQSRIPYRLLRLFQEQVRTAPASAGTSRAWNDLQIQTQGRRVSVSYQGARMEPLTGQFLLDFPPPQGQTNLRPIDRAPQLSRASEGERRALADRLFIAGLRYEARPETIPRAIRAYQKATELNPRAVGAFINLGTIQYHQGLLEEAERNYRAALVLQPGSALVHFNLGNLLEEQDQHDDARLQYEEAIRLDPEYPDPRFNLALLLDRLGQHGKAYQQWRAYLKLDSKSQWAVFAREKLAQLPLRIVPAAMPRNERH